MQLPFGEPVRSWTPNGVCPASPSDYAASCWGARLVKEQRHERT